MRLTRKKILTVTGCIAIVIVVYGVFLAMPYWRGVKPALFVDRDAAKLAKETLRGAANQEPLEDGPFLVHPDFALDLFSDELTNPRVMIEDEMGNILVSEPSAGRITFISPEGEVKQLLGGLNRPHGIALKEGRLYVAEPGQVLEYEYTEGFAANPVALLSLPEGGRHWSRTLMIGPDGALYIAVGSSCNICVEQDWRRDKILRYDFEQEELTTYASGLRNAVFFSWHPQTGDLYATEMGRDLLGDDLPPDELNKIEKNGDYGFPYCYGANIVDPEFNDSSRCEKVLPSFYDFGAHEAPLGIDFFNGDAIIALHGSWNRTVPVGYEVIRLTVESDFQERETILSGFLAEDGTTIGRPAGILVTSKNTILISDDADGTIYRLRSRTET